MEALLSIYKDEGGGHDDDDDDDDGHDDGHDNGHYYGELVEETEDKGLVQELNAEPSIFASSSSSSSSSTSISSTAEDTSMLTCEMCQSNGRLYRCPRCFIYTCSLKCCKLHKTSRNCDGKHYLVSYFTPYTSLQSFMRCSRTLLTKFSHHIISYLYKCR